MVTDFSETFTSLAFATQRQLILLHVAIFGTTIHLLLLLFFVQVRHRLRRDVVEPSAEEEQDGARFSDECEQEHEPVRGGRIWVSECW